MKGKSNRLPIVGEQVKIAAPQGSTFNGLIGTVVSVFKKGDPTIFVEIGRKIPLPFSPGELVKA